jgi:hypothetical protein
MISFATGYLCNEAVAAREILLSSVAFLFNGKNAQYKNGEVFSDYIDTSTLLILLQVPI